MQDHNLSLAEMGSLAAGTTDERLVGWSNNLYKMLKKETAQYEKMGNLFNVFAEGVKE